MNGSSPKYVDNTTTALRIEQDTAPAIEWTDLALTQHRQIAGATVTWEGELAERLMRRHIHGSWESIRHLTDGSK